MIDAKDLYTGHALSLQNQPSLVDLITAIIDPTVRITFVLGAGISINAGLPSWSRLLENICSAISDDRFARLVRADPSDTLRKSEYTLQLAEFFSPGDERSLIRDALYKENTTPRPGPLHNALARLAKQLAGRARVITTNYDVLLEVAMKDYFAAAHVNSWGPSDIDEWEKDSGGNPGDVLHVHGILEPHETPTQSVVFTESHFLSHGPVAKEVITNRLASDVVVFVGVSLTDPNLTSPLWDYKKKRKPGAPAGPFVLAVPDIADTSDVLLSYEFAISKANFFEKKLGASPIFLKSFSQLSQLIWEMTYALESKDAYKRKRNGSLASTYGTRFGEVLNRCYSRVGCNRRSDFPPTAAGESVSHLLQSMLSGNHALGRELLRLRRAYPLPAAAGPDLEHLGIFLWLRTRSHGPHLAPYSLTMVGTSAYVKRAAWSVASPIDISSFSKYTVARAVYFGSAVTENVDSTGLNAIWKGVLAVPLRIERDGDVHTVGAVSLNSTVPLSPTHAGGQTSVVGRITDTIDVFRLADQLEKSAQELLLSGWATH